MTHQEDRNRGSDDMVKAAPSGLDRWRCKKCKATGRLKVLLEKECTAVDGAKAEGPKA